MLIEKGRSFADRALILGHAVQTTSVIIPFLTDADWKVSARKCHKKGSCKQLPLGTHERIRTSDPPLRRKTLTQKT